jgi:hypothetical protein
MMAISGFDHFYCGILGRWLGKRTGDVMQEIVFFRHGVCRDETKPYRWAKGKSWADLAVALCTLPRLTVSRAQATDLKQVLLLIQPNRVTIVFFFNT